MNYTSDLDERSTLVSDADSTEDKKFVIVAGSVQVICLIAFALFSEYGKTMNDIQYTFYKDIAVMMLIGFGYLMTFLKKYGLSAVGFTFCITVMVTQIIMLVQPLVMMMYSGDWHKIKIDVGSLIDGNFGVAAVLISFGGLIGKVGLPQMSFLAVLESIFYVINKVVINLGWVQTTDMGGTIFIHLFGAYFGLAACWVYGMPNSANEEDNDSSYTSDLFSLIGTVFLWIYWPSFNGATAPQGEEQQLRTTINTVLALLSCCLSTFVFTHVFGEGKKLKAVDVQNATLAGGVCIGASSNLIISPAGALGVGVAASLLSTYGFNVIGPRLEKYGIYDTCGIHNLHGMPALLGVVVCAICAASVPASEYGGDYETMFPRGNAQAWYQLLGGVATLAFAIVTGIFSAHVTKIVVPMPRNPKCFSDTAYWGEVDGNGH